MDASGVDGEERYPYLMRMKHEVITRRRATNVTLPEELVAEARALNVNVSRACTDGLKAAVREERICRFQDEHQERVDAFTVWFEENGLPFADLRVY